MSNSCDNQAAYDRYLGPGTYDLVDHECNRVVNLGLVRSEVAFRARVAEAAEKQPVCWPGGAIRWTVYHEGVE